MEQYKVILVDDEVEVIDVMKKKIRWNDLGFDVVGSATNGVKALELVEKLQPDVVLTDIKMPYMDGLELARKLNQDYPNIYIMLCTGFDEFEYAKEAVHLEIKEYMLKPISATEDVYKRQFPACIGYAADDHGLILTVGMDLIGSVLVFCRFQTVFFK